MRIELQWTIFSRCTLQTHAFWCTEFIWNTGKRFWQSTSYTIHHKYFMKEIFHSAIPVQVSAGRNWEHDNNADVCKKAVNLEFFLSSGRNLSTEFHDDSKDCRYRSFRSINLRSFIFLFWRLKFKTQVSSRSDFPSEAMLWIKEVEMVDWGWILIVAINWRSGFPEFWNVGREKCFCLHHPKGQFGGTWSSERGSVSSRKTDCSHDSWLLSSHWRWWYGSWSRWLSLSLFVTTMFWTSTRDVEFLLLMTKISPDDSLKSLYKERYVT